MLKLVYCDFIAHLVKRAFSNPVDAPISFSIDSIAMDLGPDGEFLSPKRIVRVVDGNGTSYKITIEEDK